MHKIDYKKELNPAQLKAVESTEGPYLVIAGAGSGKTRTLVYRVAYLVEKGIKPDQILLLTFTRKASEEMLRRAAKLLDDRCEKVAGGTFHSFANMVLRKYAGLVGFPHNFTITDESDAESAVNIVRSKLGLDNLEASKRFPRKGALLDVISKSVNKSEDIATVLALEYPQFSEWEGEIKKIKEGYIRYKKEKSLMDYDDLLVFLRKLLHEHKDVRARLSGQYRYIMVDEYQDTNRLQAEIVRLLASEHGNVMVVGDDSQSIYSFRGANFKNIMDFPKVFDGAEVIMLEENYRSTQPILDLTNEVIKNAQEKFEKALFTKKAEGRAPVFVEARDENVQSKYIVQKVMELVDDGVALRDIAVLFRAGWHSNDLEIELANHDIPFLKYGGQRFVESSHIKDVISYLRIAHNRDDQVSWHRALMLMRGIGEKTAAKIAGQVIEKKQGLDIDEGILKKHPDLSELIEILRTVKPEDSPGTLIKDFLKYYDPLLKAKYDDYHKRAPDLNSLERIAGRYNSLEPFLTDMALEPPEKSILEAGLKGKQEHAMTLSTIHSAKGLEWHTVFLIYVAEGHLPSYQSIDDGDAIEEERRLFYVAATRAKENLILLKPAIDRSARWMKNYSGGYAAGGVFTEVSRFLQEGSIIERFMDVEKAGGGFDDVEFEDAFNI